MMGITILIPTIHQIIRNNITKIVFRKFRNWWKTFDRIKSGGVGGRGALNKLTNYKPLKLEGEITYSDLAAALWYMKNGKNPGYDGFTSDFFKHFWPDLGHFISRSLNFAYTDRRLNAEK